ncbi:MAG: hypothetical protein GX594_11295 [Pirellulaceae bacterium]|nr:hypothetical protein [Pirellulaceae bacterium]
MPRRCFRLLLIVSYLAAASQSGRAAEQADALRLTLPPVCYAVVGEPMSIYYDNIVLTEKHEQYRFDIQGDLGAAESRRWTVTPKAENVDDHVISVSVSDMTGRLIQRGKMVLHVAPADAGTGRAIRLLLVGDSLTHQSIYPNEIASLLTRPGNPAWTMLGTHRPKQAAEGVTHEGYGGWTWELFVNQGPDPAGKRHRSPFVFAVDGGKPRLDLDRYFASACDGKRPNYVTFMLGVNDCFRINPNDPAAIDTGIKAVFQQADKLIAAFRKAAPEAELGICLTTPPNARESGFETNYHGQFHRWGWKRIQHRLVQLEIEHFGGRQSQRIFLVPTELNLDPVDGYPANNGVHPNTAGYKQIGASVYAWLKSRLEESQP